ncbi:MAG: hypothetical protein WA431_00055, partial [Candidatus Cybelea sp.]
MIFLLAGCGGVSQTLPQPLLSAPPLDRKLKQRDLLYISNGNGTVNVYRYWQRTLVGVLTNFTQPEGECADQAGNVYIADYAEQKTFEYAHGGKKPINSIDDAPYNPYDCSVDPSTGNLAIASSAYGYYTPGSIAIYPNGSGKPIFYQGPYEDKFIACAYDDRGDLFIASRINEYYSIYYEFAFYLLPKHGNKLITEKLQDPSSRSYSGFPWVEGVAWDGKYWVVESYNRLYRFSINVTPKYISEATLYGGYSYHGPFAFYRKDLKSRATQVVGGSGSYSGKSAVDYFVYPIGGGPLHTIDKDLD